VDESLLTGESLPSAKVPAIICELKTPLGDRENMAFAGTIITSGRGRVVVVDTGSSTEVGGLATSLAGKPGTSRP